MMTFGVTTANLSPLVYHNDAQFECHAAVFSVCVGSTANRSGATPLFPQE
jgi:hypothetical protein